MPVKKIAQVVPPRKRKSANKLLFLFYPKIPIRKTITKSATDSISPKTIR